MCVDCACMSKWKQWEMDRVDLSMRTDSKDTMINNPPSHLFTDVALPLHGNWVLSDFNYWALKLVTGVKCSLVTDFIARYQYGVISNELIQPFTNRASISIGLYQLVTDMFNLCNGLYLTSKNLCNWRLRSLLPELHIGNRCCGGQPRGRPAALIGNGSQTTTVTHVGACNGR
jgi:hypothetical protein